MADEVIYINGVPYDGTDVVVYFGPLLCEWANINWEYAKEKTESPGVGGLQRRSYGAKTANGSISIRESFYQDIMQYLGPLGLDVTDLAPFPVIVNYSDKVAKEVPGLGMNRVAGGTNLLHTRILSFVDIKNARHDVAVDGKDLSIAMDFMYQP